MTLGSLPLEAWMFFFGGLLLSFGWGASLGLSPRKGRGLFERFVRAQEKRADAAERVALRVEVMEQHLAHAVYQQYHAVR